MEQVEILLVRRVQQLDHDAEAQLFRQYKMRVMRYCMSFPRIQQPDAADIVQEVFLRAFRHVRKLRDLEKFEGWLFAIARMRCLTHLKRDSWSKCREPEESMPSEVVAPQEDPLQQEREREIVEEEISRLPESSQKLAGRLFYQMGASTSEIAEQLKVPVSTVTTWLSRFRGRIRKRLIIRVLELRQAVS